MKTLLACLFSAVLLLASGCDNSPKSTRRLRLPAGNADRGRTAFIALNCNSCHTVVGVDLPGPSKPTNPMVALGGNVTQVKTAGDLLTSIIHPNLAGAKRPESPMPSANDRMTVTQMVDLVAFLQPTYQKIVPPNLWYTTY